MVRVWSLQAESSKEAVVGGDGVAVVAKMRLGAEQRYGYGLPFAVQLAVGVKCDGSSSSPCAASASWYYGDY